MSGHSKWANIKTRKGAQDKKRSAVFTVLSKNILTAIRTGGGNTNIESNLALKTAVDKAKLGNMPKENIDRLITRFEERKANLISIVLEGYGPFGVPVVVEAETDNKNRILGEIKLIFKQHGGNLGESNSVMFQFKRVGEMEISGLSDIGSSDLSLELIDAGALDFEDNVVLVDPKDISSFEDKIKKLNLSIIRSEIVLRAINPTVLNSEEDLGEIMEMIEELEDNDDVINVFAGFDFLKV